MPLVKTLKEQCRMCYSCVRECPAKAIRIYGGQAEVINERCIGCGNCVHICSQNAKIVRSSKVNVQELLSGEKKTAALVAPSFPAEFTSINYKNVVGMMRELGFDYVVEVAFGADLVSAKYRELLRAEKYKSYIGTTCPSVVFFIEKYHSVLVKNLAPIVSPMVAAARAVHRLYGDDLKIVFIGPCIAKKDEAARPDIAQDIDEVLTFRELREMFMSKDIKPENVERSEFDPPHGGRGTLYPIGGGMLQASDLNENFLSMDIVASSGNKQFVQAIKEYETVEHSTVLLELNCCEGCISGSGISHNLPLYTKRGYVSAFAEKRHKELDIEKYNKLIAEFSDLNLFADFSEDDHRVPPPSNIELREILSKMEKYQPKDELNCGACGYDTCVEHATAIHKGLAENEMCLPFTIEKLRKTATELAESYEELVKAKQAMIQSEKLASLGRMASGIAHEINNPLTGVLTYSSLMKEEMKGSSSEEDIDVIINETMRCRKIVKGLLDFARNSSVEKVMANVNDIIQETVAILKKHMTFQNIRMHIELSGKIPMAELDISQMRSVFNNLAENAAHAMPEGGDLNITTDLDETGKNIIITVADSGTGIAEENITKIFDPFFTTKEAGKGTGLGLAVIYGIIEQHYGTIKVSSVPGHGAVFTITLPARGGIKL
ncbi:MAG: histidine kinase [Spirochaetae bacterium HGW-Spirochaetae-5]|nr:MAG: histidine kinase [Spirochaetae bacterium HGW-Spirochaetae-5]